MIFPMMEKLMKILNSNQSTYPIPVQRWSGRPAPDARGLAPLTAARTMLAENNGGKPVESHG